MNKKRQIPSSKSQRNSKHQAPKQQAPMKGKRRILLFALFVALLGGLAWLLAPAADPLFHGKPESVWIKRIEYNGDEKQTQQWRELGPATHSAAALAKFVEQSATIIPALEQAAQRKDYVGGRAKRALEQIKSASQEQKIKP